MSAERAGLLKAFGSRPHFFTNRGCMVYQDRQGQTFLATMAAPGLVKQRELNATLAEAHKILVAES